MKTESLIVPDGMSSNATRSHDGKVTTAGQDGTKSGGDCQAWHSPGAVPGGGSKKTISLGAALSRLPELVFGATRDTGLPGPVWGAADPNNEASRRDGSTSPKSQELRFAVTTRHPSGLAASVSGMDPTGTMLKPNTPGSRSMRRPMSMSTAAISPRAVLVTNAKVPNSRGDLAVA